MEEKGFNDDELADIMSEIESLEQEFTDDEPQKEQEKQPEIEATQTDSVEVKDEEPEQEEVIAKQEEPEQEEVVAKQEEPEHSEVSEPVAKADDEMNEVLDELSQMPVKDVVPEKTHAEHEENVHHMRQPQGENEKHSHPAHTSMSFKVEGEMKLDLNFNIGGQDVNLHVTDHGFEIELAGGAKFSLPLASHHSGKKAS